MAINYVDNPPHSRVHVQKNEAVKSVAFFDFDGTVYDGDSMLDFIATIHGKNRLNWMLFGILPSIILWKVGVVKSDFAKKKLIRRAFSNGDSSSLQQRGGEFKEEIKSRLYSKALAALKGHEEVGDEICVVSASCSLWLQAWADECGYKLICTELEEKNGAYTGRLTGRNCIRDEKVNRINSSYNLSDFSKVFVYGKGRGDREMLRLANQPHVDISL